jgi:hypothetical protein
MPKLSDLQLILLTNANRRENGHLLPVPDSVSGAGARLKKSFGSLLKRSLVIEVEPAATDQVWREEGEQHFGLVITDAGRNALSDGAGEGSSPVLTAEPVAAAKTRTPTKQDRILELLRREQGATLDELTGATGWLPHTTRAALTGLRKKGMKIEKKKRDDVTCYRVGATA